MYCPETVWIGPRAAIKMLVLAKEPIQQLSTMDYLVTFARPNSRVRIRQHSHVFVMQGVGARQHTSNHPIQVGHPVYHNASIGDTKEKPQGRSPLVFLPPAGFIGRNSQFSSLTPRVPSCDNFGCHRTVILRAMAISGVYRPGGIYRK